MSPAALAAVHRIEESLLLALELTRALEQEGCEQRLVTSLRLRLRECQTWATLLRGQK
jgi:hypothetical protein